MLDFQPGATVLAFQESANAMLEAYARTEPIMEEMSQANVQSDIVGAERFDEVSHPPPLPPQQNNTKNHNHMVHHQATCELPTRVGLLPPPSVAFLNPKCALWDCPRPARGGLESMYYCSVFHEELAVNEGAPGMCPVVRPGGIDLKDGPLFAALGARVGGHAVGIPELQGAATSKSPWNAPGKVHFSLTCLFSRAGHLRIISLRQKLFSRPPKFCLPLVVFDASLPILNTSRQLLEQSSVGQGKGNLASTCAEPWGSLSRSGTCQGQNSTASAY